MMAYLSEDDEGIGSNGDFDCMCSKQYVRLLAVVAIRAHTSFRSFSKAFLIVLTPNYTRPTLKPIGFLLLLYYSIHAASPSSSSLSLFRFVRCSMLFDFSLRFSSLILPIAKRARSRASSIFSGRKFTILWILHGPQVNCTISFFLLCRAQNENGLSVYTWAARPAHKKWNSWCKQTTTSSKQLVPQCPQIQPHAVWLFSFLLYSLLWLNSIDSK